VPTLNRFPLLGLWAEEAARRIGFRTDEAEALGHAYAVLYAIRARGKPKKEKKESAATVRKERTKAERLSFDGDDLDVTYDDEGHVRGMVGGDRPQTPRTYAASVRAKFPPGYYEKLSEAFRKVLKGYPLGRLNSRLVYDIYDEWKRTCGVGRLVDLDALLRWCKEQTAPKSSLRSKG
jgi:hypothetical protein